MSAKRPYLLSLGLALLSAALVLADRPPSPFGVAATLTARDSAQIVRFQFEVPKEHVLYAERLGFGTEQGEALTPRLIPEPQLATDKVTGHEKKIFDRAFVAELKLTAALPVNLIVRFQGCSNGACFFPEKRMFAVGATGGVAQVTGAVPPSSPATTSADPSAPDWRKEAGSFTRVASQSGYLRPKEFLAFLDKSQKGEAIGQDEPLARYQALGLAATLLFIVIGGVGLNLTPCVLPLIPINLAIIGAGTRARSRRHGFWTGAIYGAGMALVYGALGLVVVLTGAKFGTLNSSAWFNIGIALVFVVLGLAMFDLVNVDFSRFGSGIATPRSDGTLGSKRQWIVAFALGAVAALLAGACVAPVVISVLLLSTSLHAKGVMTGLLLPFLLGVGMALPWPFAGADIQCLPKPGKWMKRIKHAFGVIILLFAVFYGHTAYTLAQTPRGNATLLAAADGVAGSPIPGADQALSSGLQQARERGCPVFLDFKASWCKNCLAMDETVLNRTNVQARLRGFVSSSLPPGRSS